MKRIENMNVKGYQSDKLTQREILFCLAVACFVIALIAAGVMSEFTPLECLK